MKPKSISSAALLIIVLMIARSAFADDPQLNLLAGKNVAVERTTLLGDSKQQLSRLTDGRLSTVTTLSLSPGVPVDIVYAFGDQTVTPSRLSVEIAKIDENKIGVANIEILVSTLSPNAGFQSLREATLKPTSVPQLVAVPPTAARWVMLRIRPAGDDKQVALAELKLFGQVGAPKTRYAFKQSPAKTIEVLARLQAQVKTSISPDASALFADARDGKLDDHSFAEAALIASGVTDREQRAKYLKQIDELENEARKSTADLKSPFDKGRALLGWLHKKSLTGGYSLHQTDLHTILDNGKFNCVSSATMYNILGRRLGLDARAIEVPDHAFAIVYDGAKHVDVETTHPFGFDPKRDEAARKRFEAQTGFAYVDDDKADLRREIRDIGLIGIIYYNHGVGHAKNEEYLKALVAYFCALSLDPEFDSSVKNALAVLANWGNALGEEKKFEDALKVINIGLTLAPKDATLLNNRKVTWNSRIIATVKDGQIAEALALVRLAAADVPDGNFPAMQSWVFIGPGEEKIKAGKWQEAMDLADSGLKQKLAKSAHDELREWRKGLVDRWWNSELTDGHFAQAALVLERGIEFDPKEKRFRNNMGFLVQEWLKKTHQDEGFERAEMVLAACLRRFPNVVDVKEAGANYLYRRMQELREQAKFVEAIQTADLAVKLLPENKNVAQWPVAGYAFWADQLVEKQDWEGALDVFAQARQRFPNEKRLAGSEESVFDKWIDPHLKKKDWAKAVEIYGKALVRLPDSKRVQQNFTYLAQQWTLGALANEGAVAAETVLTELIKQQPTMPLLNDIVAGYVQRHVTDLEKAKKHDEALIVVDRCAKKFPGQKSIPEFARVLYFRRLKTLADAKDWPGAVAVGSDALRRFPEDKVLDNNLKYFYSVWAQGHFEAKEWAKAADVLENAVKQFPQEKTFQQNLMLCKKNLKQM